MPQIGIYDNFFALGGDSLLSLQAVTKANQAGLCLTAKQVFQHPTVAQLEAVQAQAEAGVEVGPVSKRSMPGGKRPLAFAQQRLWFLQRAEPHSATYNLSSAWLLAGPLQVRALGLSLHALVQRHEILQTAFGEQEQQPVQVVIPQKNFPVAVVDLGSLPEEEREAQALRHIQQESRRPFDLTQAPLLRAMVLRLSTERHYLLLVMHHIVCDGSSLPVLYKELQAFYRQFTTGEPAGLAELPVQYADYAVWEHQSLAGPRMELQLEYWKKQLSGRLPVLDLPTDRPRPTRFSSAGARYSFLIPARVVTALRRCKQQALGVTSFHILLAAFKALLFRYTGQEDMVVGIPFSNRPRGELWDLVGFFVSTHVLRTPLSGQLSFRQLLERVQEESVEAMAHLDVPFDKLVEELRPKRDPSYTPLFQVMFACQNVPALVLEGLQVRPVEVHNGTSMFDLTLDCQETEEGWHGAIEYRTDLFAETSIARMAGHFQELLESALAHPDMPLEQLPLLSTEERHKLLVDWNQTEVAFPLEQIYPQLFAAQVSKSPQAPAVQFRQTSWSYGELDRRANRLAHHLQGLGVCPDVLVALPMERSLEFAVGVLGVLKAGGAYLPLDPAQPAARLAQLLADAGPAVVLTQRKYAGLFSGTGPQVLYLDDPEWAELKAQPALEVAPPCAAAPESLAYMIYTSGSTGQPKGVQVTHRALLNNNLAVMSAYKLGPKDRMLQFFALTFDPSIEELFPTWLTGGCVVLRTEECMNSLQSFSDFVREERISVVQVSTAFWHEWVEQLKVQALPACVRLVTIGGEKAAPEKYQIWKKHVSGAVQLVNAYGPTETTVTATHYLAGSANREDLPIGRPMANVQVYVLDSLMQPVPVGVPGELFIGGAGVARGYHNRPELTAERFIPDPFCSRPGARLYKTGDLVRWSPDGNLEFLGRIDHQIKLRGFRIEPGEIESVLLQHAQVSEAVVHAIGDSSRDKRLVAYYVPKVPFPAVAELRQFLQEKLPAYMVPATFVMLDKLPLTPNGKVDRKALPLPPERTEPIAMVPPRTPTERKLALIWREVLGLKQVGVHDNYFELGGHSLKAVWLFQKIKKVFGKELPMVTLFQAPTIAELAAVVEKEVQADAWSSLVPIKAGGTKPPFFCIHGVGGNILEFLDLAKYMDEDQPFYGLQAVGLDGKRPWLQTVEEMATHYLKEIRGLQPEGPYYLGGSSFGGLVAYEMAQQLHAQGATVALLALFDTYAPGCPKLLPTTSRLKKRIHYWQYRFSLHWGNLKVAQGPERWRYICTKALKWIRGKGTQAREFWYYWRLRFTEPLLPKEIRHVRKAGYHAGINYVAVPYSGRTTLFRAMERPKGEQYDPVLGWGGLVRGGIAVYDTPGHHGAIMRDPRARTLAEQLKDSLRKAQQRDPRTLPVSVQLEEFARVNVTGLLPTAILEVVAPPMEQFESRPANVPKHPPNEKALSPTLGGGEGCEQGHPLVPGS